MPFRYSLNSLTLGSPRGTHIRIGRDLPAELIAAGFEAAILYFWEGATNGYFYDGIRNLGAGPTSSIREWGSVIAGVRMRSSQIQMNGGTPETHSAGDHIFGGAPEYASSRIWTGEFGNQHQLGPVVQYPASSGYWGVGTTVVQARRTSIVNQGSGAAASWDAIDYGVNDMAVGTTFTPRFTGWYEISGKLRMGPQAGGTAQQTFVRLNGVNVAGGQNSNPANTSGAAGNSIPIGPVMVWMDDAAFDAVDVTGSNALAAALNWAGSLLIIKYYGSSTDGNATPSAP